MKKIKTFEDYIKGEKNIDNNFIMLPNIDFAF